MVLSFGTSGPCRGKTFESGSGNARDVTGTGGEESQIQGDGPDAERNIEREGFVLPARNGREGQKSGNPHRDVCACWTCGTFLLPVAEEGT